MAGPYSVEVRIIRLRPKGTWSDWARRGIQDSVSTSKPEASFVAAWSICFVAALIINRQVSTLLLVARLVGFVKLALELLKLFERLRRLLTEGISYGCLLTRKDVQHPPRSVFAITAGLQILNAYVLTFSADFESPLKGWRECECGATGLARFVKSKPVQCSNPIDEETATTHMICMKGKPLNGSGFGLSSPSCTSVQKPAIRSKYWNLLRRYRQCSVSVECDCAPSNNRRRLTMRVRGGAELRSWDVSVSFRSRRPKFWIWRSYSYGTSLRKEMVEYVADHPEVSFVMDVRGFREKCCVTE